MNETVLLEARCADTKDDMVVYVWRSTGAVWVVPKADADKIASTPDTPGIVAQDVAASGQTFRHFKGGRYLTLVHARNRNTLEHVVVYCSLTYGSMWVRRCSEWSDTVDRDGYKGPRFVAE